MGTRIYSRKSGWGYLMALPRVRIQVSYAVPFVRGLPTGLAIAAGVLGYPGMYPILIGSGCPHASPNAYTWRRQGLNLLLAC